MYKVIKQEEYKGFFVSTVFIGRIGINYETMVFPDRKHLVEEWCKRAITLKKAKNNHALAKRYITTGAIRKTY